MSKIDPYLHAPKFQWKFLAPKYWPAWFMVAVAFLLAYVPYRWRDKLATKVVPLIINKKSSALKRARINLAECFPEKTEEEREQILKSSLETGARFCFAYGELMVRSKKYLKSRDKIVGGENLFPLLEQGEKIITLVPHCWALDYTGPMLASLGHNITTIIKPQSNELVDWLLHKQRMQYGRGKIYPRSAGIKPFLKSVKEGNLGYYLPDEDLGVQNSVFVPFFAAEKATMKGLGKLTKLTKAKVVPLCQAYNAQTGKYELHIYPCLENFPTGDEEQDAIMMNSAIEQMVAEHPEQYMWILNLLRCHPDGTQRY
ncbi:lauroyl-Kdo(2)-lipid IV(A) myristoyltransferase [Marinomonas epiphytica]